jgi:hypothetical protein
MAVNDAPSFAVVSRSFFSSHDDDWVSFPLATNLSSGPWDERFQAVSFSVTQVGGPTVMVPASGGVGPPTSNTAGAPTGATAGQAAVGFKKLFVVPPYITPDGSLWAKLAPVLGFEGSGNMSWEVVLHDDGGIANGGVDSSPPQAVEIGLLKRPAKVTFLTLKQELLSSPGDAGAQEAAVEVVMSWDVDGLSNVGSFSLVLLASTGWNETRAVGTEVCDAAEPDRPCRALFQDLGWLPAGASLVALVQAHNSIGSSEAAEAPPGGLFLVGAPTPPETVTITQKQAFSLTTGAGAATRFEVKWSTPTNYGDGAAAGENRVLLRGYEVTVWCGSGVPSAPMLVEASNNALDLAATWSGETFVLSRTAPLLNCSKGDAVAVEVRASNFYRRAGAASSSVAVRAMGLPGAVSVLGAREVSSGGTQALNISFQLPADTGYGAPPSWTSGQTSVDEGGLVVVVQASTCSSFARTPGCELHGEARRATGAGVEWVVLTGLTKGEPHTRLTRNPKQHLLTLNP